MGFPVWPKICSLSQRWRQGKIFGQPAVFGGRLQVHFPGSYQALVVTPSLLPEVPDTRFVSPGRGIGHQAINGLDEGV